MALLSFLQAVLRTLSPLEAVAVVTGIVYVVLIMRRRRWGWVAGAISSSIYVYLSALAHLPMQSALQGYYVVMAAFGWWSWARNASEQGGRIFRWHGRQHAVALVLIAIASALSARLLATETHAAWPLLDSLTTWISLVATWMVTRSVLENWWYWICADSVMVFLFARQGYPYTAGLFAAYMIIACFGFRAWRRRWQSQSSAAPAVPAEVASPPAAALALVPGLEQGAAPQLLQRLVGGHINDTWRVDTVSGCYTLRLDGPAAMRPGVERNRELLLHSAAAAAGLAPPIVLAVPAAQLLVCAFLPGRTWSDADFQDLQNLQRLGERLALLHQLAPPAALVARFDPYALTQSYLQQAAGAGPLPDENTAVLRQLRCALDEIEAAAARPVIVHGDLPYGNVLENSQLWLLDWEYAQLADPIYDMACIAAHLPLSSSLQQRLLAAAGLGAAGDARRLPAATFVYRALTWAWHLARAERCAAPTFC